MIFTETKLKGVFLIHLEKLEDERGFFARVWDKKRFEEVGLNTRIVQCNISFNKEKGTIRGMHFQVKPFEETKIVRCVRGSTYDVIIDLRVESPTFKQWYSVELSSDNYKMLYVPKGFAHGFQTLEDNTEVFYQMSEFYNPTASKGVRWNDPTFGVKWPLEVKVISNKDKNFPLYSL